jgi:hypothetical protein
MHGSDSTEITEAAKNETGWQKDEARGRKIWRELGAGDVLSYSGSSLTRVGLACTIKTRLPVRSDG